MFQVCSLLVVCFLQAVSEPDESSIEFSFLHQVVFIGSKTKYYKQFQECQN